MIVTNQHDPKYRSSGPVRSWRCGGWHHPLRLHGRLGSLLQARGGYTYTKKEEKV